MPATQVDEGRAKARSHWGATVVAFGLRAVAHPGAWLPSD